MVNMDREHAEKVLNEMLALSLSGLKGGFQAQGISDREASMIMIAFVVKFCQLGWRGERPSKTLSMCARVAQQIGEDVPMPRV
jgi:hypothetical protein